MTNNHDSTFSNSLYNTPFNTSSWKNSIVKPAVRKDSNTQAKQPRNIAQTSAGSNNYTSTLQQRKEKAHTKSVNIAGNIFMLQSGKQRQKSINTVANYATGLTRETLTNMIIARFTERVNGKKPGKQSLNEMIIPVRSVGRLAAS